MEQRYFRDAAVVLNTTQHNWESSYSTWTVGQTDMTKLVASRHIAKAPNGTGRQGQMLEVTCCYLHNRISLICVIAFCSSPILYEHFQ
jgi:hypothetical protein